IKRNIHFMMWRFIMPTTYVICSFLINECIYFIINTRCKDNRIMNRVDKLKTFFSRGTFIDDYVFQIGKSSFLNLFEPVKRNCLPSTSHTSNRLLLIRLVIHYVFTCAIRFAFRMKWTMIRLKITMLRKDVGMFDH